MLGFAFANENAQRLCVLLTVLHGHVLIFKQKEEDCKALNEVMSGLSLSIWPALCETIKKFGLHQHIGETCIKIVRDFLSCCNAVLVPLNAHQ